MGDSLNALLQNQRSSSVLQGIANPPTVNPLAALQAGNQVAQQIFQTRQAQMNNASQFSGILAAHAMTVMKDPSDANINATFDNLAASGMPQAQIEQERQRWLGMSQDQRSDNAYRIGLVHLDQMHQVLGQTTLLNTGGQILPATTTQPGVRTPGGLAIGPGAASTTLSPSDYVSGGYHTQATQADVDAGMKGQDGQPVHIGQDIYIPGAVVNQRTGLPAPPGLGPPGGTPAALPPPGTIPGNGRPQPGSPLLNPNRPPTAAPPGVPATVPLVPLPPGSPVVGAPGKSSMVAPDPLAGGTAMASQNPAQVPATGTPGLPSPLVSGDVADIRSGMANARATPSPPGVQTAWNTITTGPGVAEALGWKASGEKLNADVQTYTGDQKAYPDLMTRAQNMGHAYDALNLLQANTGKGAANISGVRSFLGTMNMLPAGQVSDQAAMDILTKYTRRTIDEVDAAGGASADMGPAHAGTGQRGDIVVHAGEFPGVAKRPRQGHANRRRLQGFLNKQSWQCRWRLSGTPRRHRRHDRSTRICLEYVYACRAGADQCRGSQKPDGGHETAPGHRHGIDTRPATSRDNAPAAGGR